MSRKNVIAPFQMFGSGGADMSQAQVISSTTEVLYTDNIGVIVSWSGTAPVGQLFFEVYERFQQIWVPLDFGNAIAISGNSGSHDISINQLPWGRIRARYVKTSGTGTLFATLTAKQIGG